MRFLAVRVAVAAALVAAVAVMLGFGFVDIGMRHGNAALLLAAGAFAGALIGRWWAVALALVWVALLPLGERCVTRYSAPDSITQSCSDGGSDQLLVLLAVTAGALLAGAAVTRLRPSNVGPTPS